MNRKPFTYRNCTIEPKTLPTSILVGCNNSVNRYLRTVWKVSFPDKTWTYTGTKNQACQYVNQVGYSHGVFN